MSMLAGVWCLQVFEHSVGDSPEGAAGRPRGTELPDYFLPPLSYRFKRYYLPMLLSYRYFLMLLS